MQLVDLAVDDQSVARVMPALEACDHIGAFAEPVNDLAFSLVTPLGADNDDIGHDIFLCDVPRPYSDSGRRVKLEKTRERI